MQVLAIRISFLHNGGQVLSLLLSILNRFAFTQFYTVISIKAFMNQTFYKNGPGKGMSILSHFTGGLNSWYLKLHFYIWKGPVQGVLLVKGLQKCINASYQFISKGWKVLNA